MSRDIIDVYDRSIFEMKNVYTAEECQAFIDYHENSHDKRQGALLDLNTGLLVVKTDVKNTVDVYIQDSTHDLFITFIEGIRKVSLEYTKHMSVINRSCGIGYLDTGNATDPQIQRTDKGGHFGWHSDLTDANRWLAVIVYLNDIDEENGGSTEFNSGRKVQPERGKVIIFPVTHLHLHKGNVILNGPSKYIITNFIKNPNEPMERGKDDKPQNLPFIYH
tara:strand:- start:79 stop:738 length:660 start_codon:yes stop_codon:yes gene_type:complete